MADRRSRLIHVVLLVMILIGLGTVLLGSGIVVYVNNSDYDATWLIVAGSACFVAAVVFPAVVDGVLPLLRKTGERRKAIYVQNPRMPKPAKPKKEEPPKDQAGVEPGEGFTLLSAVYGDPSPNARRVNVLERVAAKVKDGRLELDVYNVELVDNDPSPEQPKCLWLSYSLDGGERVERMYHEGEKVSLPD